MLSRPPPIAASAPPINKPDAVAYLFDLSDSVRLKSSSADSYPLR
jgi:hypothetical protein